MHKLVIDTNIMISSLLGQGFPRYIVRQLILPGKVQFLLSSEIETEYRRVVGYKKFEKHAWFKEESTTTLSNLIEQATFHTIKSKFDLLTDKDDNKFLDLAYSGNADFLITGNIKHFSFGKFESTQIISPQKYWKTYWE